jgi:hypothetical protein
MTYLLTIDDRFYDYRRRNSFMRQSEVSSFCSDRRDDVVQFKACTANYSTSNSTQYVETNESECIIRI